MLDKRRIRLMTKLAAYEQSDAGEDMQINSYYKKDYVGLKTVIGAIWATIGYGMAAVLFILCDLETIMEDLSMQKLITLAVTALVGYFLVLIAYCVFSGVFYGAKHKKAGQQVKRFYNNLSRLERMGMPQGEKVKERRKKRTSMKKKMKTEENAL